MRYEDVTVVKVLYPKAEDSLPGRQFVIMRVRVKQATTREIVAKGTCFWYPSEGERIVLDGDEEVYRGELQIRFKLAEAYTPEDPKAILDYACELTNGLGPATAELIWEAYGDTWPEAVESGECKVRGLTAVRRMALVETIDKLRRDAEKTKAITTFATKTLTRNMAEAAWEKWTGAAVGVVAANPYKLAELPNYGFGDADGVAMNGYGIGANDQRRIAAYALYMLGKTCESDSMMPRADFDKMLHDKFGPRANVAATVEGLVAERRIVLHGNDVVPRDLHEAETAIFTFVTAI